VLDVLVFSPSLSFFLGGGKKETTENLRSGATHDMRIDSRRHIRSFLSLIHSEGFGIGSARFINFATTPVWLDLGNVVGVCLHFFNFPSTCRRFGYRYFAGQTEVPLFFFFFVPSPSFSFPWVRGRAVLLA